MRVFTDASLAFDVFEEGGAGKVEILGGSFATKLVLGSLKPEHFTFIFRSRVFSPVSADFFMMIFVGTPIIRPPVLTGVPVDEVGVAAAGGPYVA